MSNSVSSEESNDLLPFEFRIRDDDLDQSALNATSENDSYDDGFNWGRQSQQSESTRGTTTNEQENDFCSSRNEPSPVLLDVRRDDDTCEYSIQAQSILPSAEDAPEQFTNNASTEQYTPNNSTMPSPEQTFIAHKRTLTQIINPCNESLNRDQSSRPPVYSITVSDPAAHSSPTTTNQYQVLFSRTQYEQCIKLFTLLDTECKSSLGAECVKEFIWRYCPVVRKRDDALVAPTEQRSPRHSEFLYSPTFNEIWDVVMHSDSSYRPHQHSTRLGLESFMLFIRLLSLASHLESQRRFASRHLQQMMRHRYGSSSGVSSKVTSNEVVVVIDNPPAGPPVPISVAGLMKVELELGKEDGSKILVKDWPYASLPMVELDLDHAVVKNGWDRRRSAMIEPFSTSSDGDFILRYGNHVQADAPPGKSTVVRRSYADFCWLNETLIRQKRPGHGYLCGRILPPFPPRHGSSSSGVQYRAPRQKDVSERAVAAAKSGVGMITSVAKSLWGNYIAPNTASTKSPSSSPAARKKDTKANYSWSGLPHRGKDSPTQLARRMNRYLNYLLENQALATSFPLNAVLVASQPGLESSKQILSDYKKQQKRLKTNETPYAPGNTSSAYAILSTLLAKKPSSYFNASDGDDKPWLRIAARTAMSLQFHGILETTGHESTSAKIQHASLPKFGGAGSSWDEDETENTKNTANPKEAADGDFESGVIRIESELAGDDDIEGYDLLPSPGPSEQYHVLNATSNVHSTTDESTSTTRVRFVYGSSDESGSSEVVRENHSTDAVALGSVKVDSDIDKLKSIIKSMDHILKRLHKSSIVIESAQAAQNELQLGLLKDIDSFGDSRGGVISQRSLVDGVAALEGSNSALNASNGTISDDFGWQSALASSAVGATEEVKEAVIASRTASRAKSAAFTAAAKSKKMYESLDSSSSKDEINAAQLEASATQSHAIHATVVEYEANTAKKRAAVSFAEDVKCWNSYRKREVNQTCLEYARSQREARRNAADAWECLRCGLIDSTAPLFAPGDIAQLTVSNQKQISECVGCIIPSESNLSTIDDAKSPGHTRMDTTPAASIPEAFVDVLEMTSSAFDLDDSVDNVYLIRPPDMSNLDDDHFALQQDIISAAESSIQSDDEAIDTCTFQADDLGVDSALQQRGDTDDQPESHISHENMTTSMLSLIDGLMAWGGEEEPVNDIGYQVEGVGRRMKTSSLLE